MALNPKILAVSMLTGPGDVPPDLSAQSMAGIRLCSIDARGQADEGAQDACRAEPEQAYAVLARLCAMAEEPFVFLPGMSGCLEPETVEKLYWRLLTSPQAAYACGLAAPVVHPAAPAACGNSPALRAGGPVLVRAAALRAQLSHQDPATAVPLLLRTGPGSLVPEYFGMGLPRLDTALAASPVQIQSGFTLPENLDEFAPAYPARASQKQRLLFVVPWLVMGGADQFNLHLVQGLARRGWDTTIVTTIPSRNELLDNFRASAAEIFMPDKFLEAPDFPRFLLALIRSRAYDAVLFSNSEFACRLSPWLRVHFPGLPLINYTHIEEMGWRYGGHPRMAAAWSPFFTTCVAASRHLEQWLREQGAANVTTCTINVDTEVWKPDPVRRAAMRADWGVEDNLPVIVHAARICAQKQPFVLLDALHILAENGHDYLAVIIGDGPDLQALRKQAAGLGGRVRFTGAQPQEAVRRAMQGGDIFFLPSQNEGIALSLFEAMACGMAVLSADVGGQRELCTPETGRLISPQPYETQAIRYAAELERWLDDLPALQRMRLAARRRVETYFPLSRMIDRMESIFRQAASDAKIQAFPASPALGRLLALDAIAAHQRYLTTL